jgi:histidinol phosphatase-like PHP family hydrolase
MDKHARFKAFVEAGRYWFHLHTTLTDASLTIPDYADLAREAGIAGLGFLEHVRARPSYDTAEFLRSVRRHFADRAENVLAGFEAKLLPGGRLDIRNADVERADVLDIAEHGWRGGPAELEEALLQCVERYSASCPLVWVHPGRSQPEFRPGQAGRDRYRRLLTTVSRMGVRVERNLRYGCVDPGAEGAVAEGQILTGVDCHTVDDLKSYEVSHSHSVLRP